MNKTSRKSIMQYVTIGFFILVFVLGLLIVGDYGISFDEGMERSTTNINALYVIGLLKQVLGKSVDYMPDLANYHDGIYGVAVRLPLVALEVISDSPRFYFVASHYYIFLLFFISLICLYNICRKCKFTDGFALLTVILYVVSPRILAEACYNIKDSIFASMFLMNMLSGMCYLEAEGKKEKWHFILFAFLSALTINTRFIGGAVFGLFLILKVMKYFAGIEPHKKGNLTKMILQTLVMIVLCVILFIAMTPYTWSDPIGHTLDIVKSFSNYVVYSSPVMLNGRNYATTELPWYYLTEFMTITTPTMYTLGAVFGIGLSLYFIYRVVRREFITNMIGALTRDYAVLYRCVLTCLVVGVLLADMILTPAKYDEWRHFRFLYPYILMQTTIGYSWIYDKIINRQKLRYIPIIAIGISIIMTAGWMIKNHPYQYTYYNPLVRGVIADNFEKDYWAVANYESIQYILANDDTEVIDMFFTPSVTQMFLTDEEAARVHLVEQDEKDTAEYVLETYRYDTQTNIRNSYLENGYDVYRDVMVDGYIINTIYKKK